MNQELPRCLLEGQAVGRGRLRFDLASEVGNGLLEVRIVPRDRKRRAVLCERFRKRTLAMVDIGEPANRREILRSALEHVLEFLLRLLELLEFDERAAKRHAGGKIRRMNLEARPAHVHGFLEHRGPAVFFGELRKSDGRRVLLDPSSQIVEARAITHRRGLLCGDVLRRGG